MKIIEFKRVIGIFLCIAVIQSFLVSAAYKDDFNGSYSELNCAEDDCDCLEPVSDMFRVVSPESQVNLYNKIVMEGSIKEVQNYYKKLGQTDGIPIIPPTTLKVEKFMRYTPYNDNDIVSTVNGRNVTAYQVAVNAVMSGCSAEYMPVCIAFVKAMGNGEYMSSLKNGSSTPMLCISGPVSRQLGIDNTQGMTLEEANLVIGRFIELSLINLAGVKIERNNPFGYVQPLVFSENEKACLETGWNPLHKEKGYDLNDSVITASSFSMWGNNLTPATDLPEEIMKLIAWDITEKNLGALGGADSYALKNTRRVIFITEPVAKVLSTRYITKENLEDALIENARLPIWSRAKAYYYGNAEISLSKSFEEVYEELKVADEAKYIQSPSWIEGIADEKIESVYLMKKGNTDIIITGDSSRNKTQVMPGGYSVTVEIELPDMWDLFLTSMSYKKLSDFHISEKNSSILSLKNLNVDLKDGTYRILEFASMEKSLTSEGRVCFDSSSDKLYYWEYGKKEADSKKLNSKTDASLITYLGNLGANSSFTVDGGKITEVVIRFSSNAQN